MAWKFGTESERDFTLAISVFLPQDSLVRCNDCFFVFVLVECILR